MQDIDWNIFKAKFSGKEQDTFQWLCYLLFCEEYKQSLGISRYENQAGIETDPIKVGNYFIGWQAKFYDTRLSEHKKDFISSIDTSKTKYPDITKIVFFTNKDFGQNKKNNLPGIRKSIEDYADKKGISIIWKTASYFESPFVVKDNDYLIKYFFSNEKSVIDLIEDLNKRSEYILGAIKSKILFKNNKIKIDRSATISAIVNSLQNNLPLIVSGDSGVGKTATIKDFFCNFKTKIPIFIFKASEFNNLRYVAEIFHNFSNLDLSSLIKAYEDLSVKCIVIDSAEKLSDIENKDVFQEFISTLIKNNWKIIFTTRHSYLDDLRYSLINFYGLSFQTIELSNITREDLANLASSYHFNLPTDNRMAELLCNPFYLNEYLRNYLNIKKDISYQEFKNILWNIQIVNSIDTKDGINIKREEYFLILAIKRANEGNFYIKMTGSDHTVLQKLVMDEVIGYEKNIGSYFITHDIYEEWALEKVIEREFIQNKEAYQFFKQLGNSLPVRRAFRHWLSDKLIDSKESVELLVKENINNGKIEDIWKDEILTAVLISDHSEILFKSFEKELVDKNLDLLTKITFLLRIACKEVDEDYFKLLGIQTTEEVALQTLFTKPKGSGWSFIIGFINTHKAEIGLKGMNSILFVLTDWVNKYKVGITTKNCGQIALFYYEYIASSGGFGYSSRELEEKIVGIILEAAVEIRSELSQIIDEIVIKKEVSHRSKYYELAQSMLSSVMKTTNLARAIPDKVISLAKLYWIRDLKIGDPYSSRIDIEQYFSLTETHHDYFPSSPYQTPIHALLRFASKITIDFILWIVNLTSDYYSHTSLSKNEMEEVLVYVDDNKPITQYMSCRLWEMYRGTHVSPSLLESIHMALEKWLLEYSKSESQGELERICLYLLQNSKSASITSVVESIVFSEPIKLFKIAAILFKTKEFFLYDTTRYMKDQTHKSSLEMLRDNFPQRDFEVQIMQNERIKACEDQHRKNNLENLAVYYQFFITKDEKEEIANERQKIIWSIFDNYYKELPPISKETGEDKTWRIYLARMDRRKMHPKIEKDGDQIQIHFNPEMDTKLKEYSEKSLKRSSDNLQYSQLQMWARYRFDRNEEYKKYGQYDNNPTLVVLELKEVISKLKDKNNQDFNILNKTIPAYVSSVLIRDYFDRLKIEEKDLCRDTILEYASIPLSSKQYRFQFGEGVEPAILTLAELLHQFPQSKRQIKMLLIMLLLNRWREISTYAIRTILHNLWNINPEEANSLFLGYLQLKPKYDVLADELREQQYKKRIYEISEQQISEVFNQRNSTELEKIVSNNIKYTDLKNIEDIDLEILNTGFELLPLKTQQDEHKQFLLKIFPIFSKRIFIDDEKYDFVLKNRFLKKYAYFILSSSTNEIKLYIEPFLKDLNDRHDVADLFKEFISAEDSLNLYDSFWLVWELFYEKIIESIKGQKPSYYSKEIIRSYLFASTPWKETAKSWRSFKDKEKYFFSKVCNDMKGNPSALYSISKLLNDIGQSFEAEGIYWLANIIEGDGLSQDLLEVNTIYYIENFIRRQILRERQKIKKDLKLKNRVATILNYLVNNGSSVGYLLREDLL